MNQNGNDVQEHVNWGSADEFDNIQVTIRALAAVLGDHKDGTRIGNSHNCDSSNYVDTPQTIVLQPRESKEKTLSENKGTYYANK